MDFKPPTGWKKGKPELSDMRKEHGRTKGINFVQRFNGKPFGVIILGHEAGTQLAASQISASIQFRGGYVPVHCEIAMTYVGAGPNAQDREVLAGRVNPTWRDELDHSLDAMVDSMMQDIKINRKREPVVYHSDRT